MDENELKQDSGLEETFSPFPRPVAEAPSEAFFTPLPTPTEAASEPITGETLSEIDEETPFIEAPREEAVDTTPILDETFTTPSGAVVRADGTVVSEPERVEVQPEIDTPFADMAESIFNEIQGINQETADIEAFTKAREEEEGITELTATQNDLFAKAKSLALESQRLQNELTLAEERLQQEFAGRGVTVGGLAPITAAKRREIALAQADVASRALITQAELYAVEGKLSTARQAVDRAVDAKYGPLLREKQNLIDNLNLLNQSGILGREESRRAEEQLRRETAERERIQEARDIEAGIEDLIIQNAVTLGRLPNGSQIMDSVREAGSVSEAAEIIGRAIGPLTTTERKTQITEANGRRLLVDTQTGEIIRDLGISDIKAGVAVEPKPAQRIAAGFAARIEAADKVITELEADFTGTLTRIGFVPEGLKTEDRKRIEQAERNFINAVLRRESGAAIAPSEFESAALQYFPQRGDDASVLEQKQQNRQIAFESLRLEAGPAFTELKGALPDIISTVNIGGTDYPVGTIIENSQGQRGRVESDGTITLL